MKIRMIVEYDPDWPEGADPHQWIEHEIACWKDGRIDVQDVIQGDDGIVKWEIIP